MRSTIIILILIIVSIFTSCKKNEPRIIPEEILKKILIESSVADSYARLQISSSRRDTLSVFEPIFAKYGYTPSDLRNTIEVHSRRKSNVLVVLIDDAVKELDKVRSIAQFRSDLNKSWNEKAREYSKEVIYERNNTLKYRSTDSLKNYKIRLPLTRIGEYNFTYRYFIDSTDLNSVRYFNYHRRDSVSKKDADQSTIWLSYKKDKYQTISHSAKIDKLDTLSNQLEYELIYYGNNNKFAKKPKMDFDSIKITYFKPTKEAARLYYEKVLGIDTLYKFIKRIENEKDSIPLPNEWWKINKEPADSIR